MREKYVEERFPRYMIFGERLDGSVDVEACTQGYEVVSGIDRATAERLIADRDAVINMLVRLALAFDKVSPVEFSSIWYGASDQ